MSGRRKDQLASLVPDIEARRGSTSSASSSYPVEINAGARSAETGAQSRVAQAVARLAEDLHRTVVEESPLPLMLLDRDGAVV
ncbi:MAG: hypothetical protein ACTHQQ_01775 [Solirubrobacteraceae bacterium]